ncbi:MAG: carboxypeptidase regulatory-like domain-containing protein [Myxococcales bacterium]|nr:carboxypeptidase regulatory-like domain-containing protein [Myxococcales bacterium]MCB9704905.1 carboxypeptidase regulatory-like domain-containing protein [Myxococcales bacterium]
MSRDHQRPTLSIPLRLLGGAALVALLAAPADAAAQEATTTTTTTTTTSSTSTSSAAVAGSSGMITGVVSDEQDRGLGGVVVAIECGCLPGSQERITDENGVFVFEDLPAGKYTIKAFQAGESAAVRETALAGGGFVQVDVSVAGSQALAAHHHDDDDDDDDDHHGRRRHHDRHEFWGGVSIGLVFSGSRAPGSLAADQSRITTNQLTPWSGPVRGIDVRWQTFDVNRGRFPRTIGYFRSGFARGSTDFHPGGAGEVDGQATSLEVLTVPLFLGGNLYLFRDFPVRPYAGLGFGFDIMRLAFTRRGQPDFVDTSARIGFEIHGGIEVRITNYIALTGEVTQLWSARRRLPGLPDVSNESFTALLGVAGAFPIHR